MDINISQSRVNQGKSLRQLRPDFERIKENRLSPVWLAAEFHLVHATISSTLHFIQGEIIWGPWHNFWFGFRVTFLVESWVALWVASQPTIKVNPYR
jgi:hypothetical protein